MSTTMRGRDCDSCGGSAPRAARYCPWCGDQIREIESFETPAVED